jgi:AcrR family transcriptional regulator
VRAAIALADSEGLAAVSMRRIAGVLDARVMSLYTHVASKDDLLDLMFEELAGRCIVRRQGAEAWPDAVRRMARRWREVAMAHPWSVELLGRRARVGPQTLRLLDSWIAAVDTMTATLPQKWAAVSTVNDYVVGYVVRECAQRAVVPAEPDAAREWQATMNAYLDRMAGSGDYPHIATLLGVGFGRLPDNFETGLDHVITGIAAAHGDGAVPEVPPVPQASRAARQAPAARKTTT